MASNELLEEFIYDLREHLNTASDQLLKLEKDPFSLNDLNDLASTIHTIKGNSGFLGFKNIYHFLHNAENILQTMRGQLPLPSPPEAVDLVFQVMDALEAIVFRLENGLDDQVDWLPELNRQLQDLETALENRNAASEAPASRPTAVTPDSRRAEEKPAPRPPHPAPAALSAKPASLIMDRLKLENSAPAQIVEELSRLLAQTNQPVEISLTMIDNLSRTGLNRLLELRALAPGRVFFAVPEEQKANYQRLWRIMGLNGAGEIVAAG